MPETKKLIDFLFCLKSYFKTHKNKFFSKISKSAGIKMSYYVFFTYNDELLEKSDKK